jgi:hypothetical protein
MEGARWISPAGSMPRYLDVARVRACPIWREGQIGIVAVHVYKGGVCPSPFYPRLLEDGTVRPSTETYGVPLLDLMIGDYMGTTHCPGHAQFEIRQDDIKPVEGSPPPYDPSERGTLERGAFVWRRGRPVICRSPPPYDLTQQQDGARVVWKRKRPMGWDVCPEETTVGEEVAAATPHIDGTSRGTVYCVLCDEWIPDHASRLHRSLHRAPCAVCGFVATEYSDFVRHSVCAHFTVVEGGYFVCTSCPERRGTWKSITRHWYACHNGKPDVLRDKPPLQRGASPSIGNIVVCGECRVVVAPTATAWVTDLDAHMTSTHPEKKGRICGPCGRITYTESHVCSAVAEVDVFVCKWCKKQSDTVLRHAMHVCHARGLGAWCALCPHTEPFQHKSLLRTHLEVVHGLLRAV